MAIYGKGIYEKGKHRAKIGQKHTKEYLVWRAMISRCYNPMYLDKHPTYEKCEVCEKWLYFQKFCEWFEKNYYEISGEIIDLDKDFKSILFAKNDIKVYSPNTCMFIPQQINKTITFQRNKKTILPTGVKATQNKDIYSVSICSKGLDSKSKERYIGRFNSMSEAFSEYVKAKEKYLDELLLTYEHKIPNDVFDIIKLFISNKCFEKIYNH